MEQAIYQFLPQDAPLECKPLGNGQINSTFRIKTRDGLRYVLQRINTFVFKNPDELMQNVFAVTEHIRAKGELTLRFLPTLDGKPYFRDEAGDCWRCYTFVSGLCLEAAESDEDFYQSALAFGRFQEQLADFPADTLFETIPNFHNTPDRFRQLHEAVEENAAGRLENARPELDFLFAREEEAGTIQRLLDAGDLPLRVTHNDTKLNNVLLDRETRQALCVLDLDTVMPGTALFDYGDSIRFGAATAPEDTPLLDEMTLDLGKFDVYTRGFLDGCHTLTPKEIELLPLGAKTITLELAARFLKDYLDGDKYFKTQYLEHNLVRTRAQLKLAAEMERKWDEMQAIVKKYAGGNA